MIPVFGSFEKLVKVCSEKDIMIFCGNQQDAFKIFEASKNMKIDPPNVVLWVEQGDVTINLNHNLLWSRWNQKWEPKEIDIF